MKSNILKFKAVIALLLSAALVFGACPFSAFADEDEKEKDYPLYKGTFRYSGKSPNGDDEFFYSDAFFTKPGTETNVELRSMSAVIAMATNSFSDEKYVGNGITDLFTDIGFNPDTIDIKNLGTTSKDTIGTVITHKNFEGVPLIAVAIRGNDYREEWASNFCLGEDGDPEGFSTACEKVMTRIKDYMSYNSISNAKFWVMGYSRAGAVANLVGRKLNENKEKYGTNTEDIYVYTFEAARSSTDETVYENIHNIVDKNDLVPYVYPSDWDIGLNGVEELIGDDDETITGKSFDISANGFVTDTFDIKKSDFLEDFISFFCDHLSRDEYVSDLQDPLMTMTETYFKKSSSGQKDMIEFFTAVIDSAKYDGNTVAVILKILAAPDSDDTINSVTDLIHTHMKKVRNNSEYSFTDDEFDAMYDCVKPLVKVVSRLVKPEMMYTTERDGKKLKLPFFHILTFGENISELIKSHWNENFFARIKSYDPHYEGVFTVPAGKVICGETYSYDELGEDLFKKAGELGFDDSDLKYLKNGYNLSIENTCTELESKDVSDKLLASVNLNLDDDEKLRGFYSIELTKKTGFRTEKTELNYPDYKASVTLETDPDEERSYSVYRLEGDSVEELECTCEHTDDGDVLRFSAPKADNYAISYTAKAVEGKSGKGTEPPIILIIIIAAAVLGAGGFAFMFFRRKKKIVKH